MLNKEPFKLYDGTKIQLKTKITPDSETTNSSYDTLKIYIPVKETVSEEKSLTLTFTLQEDTTKEEAVTCKCVYEETKSSNYITECTLPYTGHYVVSISDNDNIIMATPGVIQLLDDQDTEDTEDDTWINYDIFNSDPIEVIGSKNLPTAIPALDQGEPLFNTNDNRLYIGPKYEIGKTDLQTPDVTTTFMPMKGKKGEYHIQTVYAADGTNDGISLQTDKLAANIPVIDISSKTINISKDENTPLVDIKSEDNKTTIHTDVDIERNLNVGENIHVEDTGGLLGIVSFEHNGNISTKTHSDTHSSSTIWLSSGDSENTSSSVIIQAEDPTGRDSLISVRADTVGLIGKSFIQGPLMTQLSSMSDSDSEIWYDFVGQSETGTPVDLLYPLKHHSNFGVQYIPTEDESTSAKIKLPDNITLEVSDKYTLGSDNNYFKRIHSYGYDIYDDSSKNLVDLTDYIDDAISGVVNKVTITEVLFNFEATPKNVSDTLAEGVNIGDIGIIKKPIDSTITTTTALNSYEGKYQYTCYVWNGEVWEAADGEYDARNVYFHDNIKLAGDYTQVGNLTKTPTGTADLECKGKSLYETFEKIFTSNLDSIITLPSYNIANLSYTSDNNEYNSTPDEIGSYITDVRVNAYYTDGTYSRGRVDSEGIYSSNILAGCSPEYEVSITDPAGVTEISSTLSPSFDITTKYVQIDSTSSKKYVTAQGKCTYSSASYYPATSLHESQGPNSDIKEGVITKTCDLFVTGVRYSFAGTTTSHGDIDSDTVRSLSTKTKSNTFDISITPAAKRVIIATKKSLISVKDVNDSNSEIKGSFSSRNVDVNGANNFTADTYNVYTLDFSSDYGQNNTYTVTLN